MKNCLLLLVSILFHKLSFSQVEIGSWRSHQSANSFDFVGQLNNKLLGANSSGVLIYDMEDNSVQFLSKINVLSETNISTFRCSNEAKACIIGYSSGNLDIITADLTIVNQPALKNNLIVGNKSVNDISFKDESAILSTGIGFLELDLTTFNINSDRKELVNQERLEAGASFIFGDTIYFTTQLAVYKCEVSSLFEGGQFYEVNFPENPDLIDQFFLFQGDLYATYVIDSLYEGDTLYKLENNQFKKFNPLAGQAFKYVTPLNDSIIIAHADQMAVYDNDFNLINNIYTYGNSTSPNPRQFQLIENNDLIVADRSHGLILSTFENQFNSNIIQISSPTNTKINPLTVINNTVFAMPGGSEYTFNNPIINIYENNSWMSYDYSKDANSTLRNLNGIVEVNGHYFISTDKVGIVELDETFKFLELYDNTNSSIQDARPTAPTYDYFGITDITTTSDGTIYALNNQVEFPLIIRTINGNWLSTKFEEIPTPKTGDIIANDNGFLVLNITDVGVLVYNTNNTPDILSDDSYKLLTTSPTSGNLPSGNVTCLTIDRDGELWIGSDAGIAIIYSLESVFNSTFEGAQQIIVNQDGYNGYLFETETVEAIAVDGANRKWVATASSGLFLISADGLEQIHNFTTENSPLLTNSISDVVVHPTSGEVFISSDKGLISYRSDATEGVSSTEELIPFPNPVKPGYNGQIAIKNLAENSFVRITDQAGNLIYETTSLGGQAVWDGKNRDGKPVTSGVYLVFANGGIGNRGQTGKIMIFR